jgi:hypothetical protein
MNTATDPLARIAAANARREAQGLVSVNGIACPTQEWVDYYNAREAAPRDASGNIPLTAHLRDLKSCAVASTSH